MPTPKCMASTCEYKVVCQEISVRPKNYKTQRLPHFKSLSVDWSTQHPITCRRRVSQPEHPSVMASVWAKSFVHLPVLSAFFLLLLCLPPGGGQKKKEVMLQPLIWHFQRTLLCCLIKRVFKLNLLLCVNVKLVGVSQNRQEVCQSDALVVFS